MLLLCVSPIASCKKSISKVYELTGIKLSATSINLKVGESVEIKAAAIPAAANQPNFNGPRQHAIAIVANGLVKEKRRRNRFSVIPRVLLLHLRLKLIQPVHQVMDIPILYFA